jgi:hypothetical protein
MCAFSTIGFNRECVAQKYQRRKNERAGRPGHAAATRARRRVFAEYAQTRGFVIDAAVPRHPTGKGYASYCTSSVASVASLRRRCFAEMPFHLFRTGASVPGGS